jgi:regulatory protein
MHAEAGAAGGSTGRVVALGPEERLQHALELAYRHLARRERTVSEVRARLEREAVDTATIDTALRELERQGAVDDAGYARRFAEDRRRLDGWGSERIERRLLELGIPAELVAAELGGDEADAELRRALEVLGARLAAPPADERERDRALRLLARRGFGLELAYDAVRAFERA